MRKNSTTLLTIPLYSYLYELKSIDLCNLLTCEKEERNLCQQSRHWRQLKIKKFAQKYCSGKAMLWV